jgi:hypothetical protein
VPVHRSTLWRKCVTLLLSFVALVALASPAGATPITGIADENIAGWSPATWTIFNATGVKQVRHTVPWNVADGNHAGELQATTNWINQAKARGLQILISFRVNWGENIAPPTSEEYLGAVYKFRQLFPWITTYTAWNEPNHQYSSIPNANTNGNPKLAAQYWVALNSICHSTNFPSTCTVIAGDFLEPRPEHAANFKENFVIPYKQWIASTGGSPTAWAIHPYTATETGNWSVFTNTFKPLTENKPIWFTEVGGMVCKSNTGYTAGTLSASLQFANGAAANLVQFSDAKVARTYYYALSEDQDQEHACPGFDSTLLGANSVPRPAFDTVFPAANIPADFSGDRKGDVLAAAPDGSMWMYRGNGAGWWITGNGEQVGNGWTGFDILLAHGDFSGDRLADVIARKPDGTLSLYRGNGSGGWVTGNGMSLGGGWNQYNMLVAPGDFTGDSKADLIGRKPDGTLWLYRGNGKGGWITGSAEFLNEGWHIFDLILGSYDFSGDGQPDLIARKPDGALYLYRGNGQGGFIPGGYGVIGSGWNSFNALMTAGDFSGDGTSDLLARKPDGSLWLYRGNGAGGWVTGNGEWIGGGWGVFTTLLGE